ncbi:UDP-2,4-diacetamido-2,4,6-trideoxy-beta-L-altropyranose hydrolase [Synechococcus sp. HIMB2401]|uniref:UDP-2,4-diacetamido-2,4, 6-trideoxy-beta-L-altropyranose hydrolase n=1 Tax=Synechococcus sp. HIMB2401 TaxID=3144208 RepID=UPI0036F3B6BD
MKRILIRCDASLSIGSGHVMRCRTLARELQRRGAAATFLCRRQPGDLINLLKPDFSVLALPEQPLAACDGLGGRDLYSSWLGCTQEQDAAQCLEVLAKAGINDASWIVSDHYGLDARWEAQMLAGLSGGDAGPKLLVIDDLADRTHQADLLLDQNFFGGATHRRYQDLVPPQCRQLLGPHYALLGQEYAQLHPLVPPRTQLSRVLVFFGGVDPSNLTCRALEALMDLALADLAVDVVLGLQSPHRQAVKELVARRPNTTLHEPLPSLAGLIARADLAIGAGGATTWERACLRLPSLVVAIAANQLPFSQALDKAGHLQLLGDGDSVTAQQIRCALLQLKTEPRPGKAANALTDGWGAPRLAVAMLGTQGAISLRTAVTADESLLSYWAKDPEVNVHGFAHESIEPEDHHHWWQESLKDQNRLLLIATTADGCPIGQIRFDRQSASVQDDASEALVNLSLDRCAHGFGLSADLVRLGLEAMEQRWRPAPEAIDNVLNSNTFSSACYARGGFISHSELFSESNPPLSDGECLALAPSRITLLSDCGSWLNDFLPDLLTALWRRGHVVRWVHTPAALCPGDVCLLLSCGRLLNAKQLALHRYNLVVHESALPQGQGWSPMTWQILQGASSIPITLFEAVTDLDAGPIYLQQEIKLQGHELVDEWRVLQASATFDLCLDWFDRHYEVVGAAKPQYGIPSHYPRRYPTDSQLDPELSLAKQFNLLRVVDNHRYPASFQWHGRRYILNLQSD